MTLATPDDSGGIATIDLSNLKLYGRSQEISTLIEAYRRVSSKAPSELVLVSGYSGTGKSALVQSLKAHTSTCIKGESSGGRFVSGKFDQLRRSEPYSAIVLAFGELFEHIFNDSDDALCRARGAVVEAVPAESMEMLMNALPGLQNLIGRDESPEEEDPETKRASFPSSPNYEKKFNSAFCSLVRSICSPRPVVIFLDDVQWADLASLDLLKVLLADPDSSNVLYVLSFRDNEVDGIHPLMLRLWDVENSKNTVATTKIHVGNLDVDTINDLISDVLRLEPNDTRPLAKLVVGRTLGNVFFAIHFLELLRDEGLLTYSLHLMRWTWDVDLIESSTVISDNVVDMVMGKLRRLPANVQEVLKTASCLGSYFDGNILKEVMPCLKSAPAGEMGSDSKKGDLGTHKNSPGIDSSFDLVSALGIALSEGLIVGLQAQEAVYRFVHDRIQQASYSLFEKQEEKELMHLRLGNHLQKRLRKKEKSRNCNLLLFMAVDQLNLGSAHIEDQEKKIDLARLNIQAGEKAALSSAFFPAASYLHAGLKLLNNHDRMWSEQYDLALPLHIKLARVEYVCGNMKESREAALAVIANGRCIDDKNEAYFFLFKLLHHSAGNIDEALDVAAEFLKQVGECFDVNPSRLSLNVQYVKTKMMLQSYPGNALLEQPTIQNKRKKAAMTMIMLTSTSAVVLSRENLFATAAMRIIQLSLTYGFWGISAAALAMYGSFLCKKGDFCEGYRFGQLALSLEERLDDKSWTGVTSWCVFGNINHWRQPLQQSLDPLLHIYEAEMLRGELSTSFLLFTVYSMHYVYSGMPLAPLEADMKAMLHEASECNIHITHFVAFPLWQFMLNLIGRSENPLRLTGEAMDQEETFNFALGKSNVKACASMYFMRAQLAYYFDDIDLASEMLSQSRSSWNGVDSFGYCRFAFFDSLVSYELARRGTSKKKWMHSADRVARKMTKWVKSEAVNILHMLLLLKAEKAAAQNQSEKEVKKAYDDAISTAGRNGFTNDQALACERAGVYFVEQGEKDWASYYLSRSHELYLSWGAKAKTDSLRRKYPSLLVDSGRTTVTSSRGLRGRSRFDESVREAHKSLSLMSMFSDASRGDVNSNSQST